MNSPKVPIDPPTQKPDLARQGAPSVKPKELQQLEEAVAGREQRKPAGVLLSPKLSQEQLDWLDAFRKSPKGEYPGGPTTPSEDEETSPPAAPTQAPTPEVTPVAWSRTGVHPNRVQVKAAPIGGRMDRKVVFWVSGILASGCFGALIGSFSSATRGVVFILGDRYDVGTVGFVGGMLAFICVGLWLKGRP
jgi:hypothetical protein